LIRHNVDAEFVRLALSSPVRLTSQADVLILAQGGPRPLDGEIVPLSASRCKQRLGGLLKSCSQKAAERIGVRL
jgi:hypothetical protein